MSAGSTYDVNRRGIMETLSKVPLFSGLGDEQLVHLGSVVRSKEYGPGSVILAEGDPGRWAGSRGGDSFHMRGRIFSERCQSWTVRRVLPML